MNKNDDNRNICLYGFRCTGKTTVGGILARLMNRSFIDTDADIQKTAGMTVSEIVKREGWQGFRSRETMAVTAACLNGGNIIALGGGAVTIEKNVDILKKNALLVWLKAKPETVRARMQQDNDTKNLRPALSDNGDPFKEVMELMEKRMPVYAAVSELAIDTDDNSPDEIAHIILKMLSQN